MERDLVVPAEVILTGCKNTLVRHLGNFGPAAMHASDECLRMSFSLAGV